MKLYFENKKKLNEDVGTNFINKLEKIIIKYMKQAIEEDIYEVIDWYGVIEGVQDAI